MKSIGGVYGYGFTAGDQEREFLDVMIEGFDGNVTSQADLREARQMTLFERPCTWRRIVGALPFGGPRVHEKLIAANVLDVPRANFIQRT